MSDRIAVMNGGLVEQVGGPREIYERPATAFVADFIGSLNAFDFRRRADRRQRGDAGRGGRADRRPGRGAEPAGETLRAAVRPEQRAGRAGGGVRADGGSRLEGTLAEVVFLGMYTQFHVDTAPAASSPTGWRTSARPRSSRRARRALVGRGAGLRYWAPGVARRRAGPPRPRSRPPARPPSTTTATAITCGSWLGKRSAE